MESPCFGVSHHQMPVAVGKQTKPWHVSFTRRAWGVGAGRVLGPILNTNQLSIVLCDDALGIAPGRVHLLGDRQDLSRREAKGLYNARECWRAAPILPHPWRLCTPAHYLPSQELVRQGRFPSIWSPNDGDSQDLGILRLIRLVPQQNVLLSCRKNAQTSLAISSGFT